MMNLPEILEKHRLWVEGKEGGVKADLSGANLSGANLSYAYLSGADLSYADLSYARLSRANLFGAYLSCANLSRANLSGADLPYANLSCSNLSGANLSYANLSCANLSCANLSDADLSGANLPHFQICPEEGDFIGWKKLSNKVVAKLLIPATAKRTSSLVGRKCRAEFVVVLAGEGASSYDRITKYIPGATVYPDEYDDDIRVECTSGIHFFITRKEAEEYCV
jgi:hypothetical protein